MHRLRLSSEAPEVVSRIPDAYFVPYSRRFPSPKSALYQKQDDIKRQTPLVPLTPSRASPSTFEEDQPGRRFGAASCSLFTVLLVIGAFLLGGGVGGGIGGAFIAKDRAKISSLTSSLAVLPTITVTPSSAPTACFLDQAGCPNINNTTYISSTTPAHTFLQICETNIISKTGKSIDISGTIQLSWKACMDSCADYNTKVKQGGCQGATWQMFSSTNPSNNSVCTLKSSAQFTTGQASSEQLCSGILLS